MKLIDELEARITTGGLGEPPAYPIVQPPGISQFEWDRLLRELEQNRQRTNANN
jgi:hypothetical protein